MSAQTVAQPALPAAPPASAALSATLGGTITAPNAPVERSRASRAVGIARDLVIAVMVVWALPLAAALLVALGRFLANAF